MKSEKIVAYLEKYKDLPEGCKLYFLSNSGTIFVAEANKVSKLDQESDDYSNTLHTFINEGNEAHYLLGTPDTNEAAPSNSTVKLGKSEPHHHFVPHAHGVEHYVYSKGFSGCMLFDRDQKKARVIKLIPGTLIYISAMTPHSFYNRSDIPLITLIANGGLGINDDRYAITKDVAEKLIADETDTAKKQQLEELMDELGSIESLYEETRPQEDLSSNEKLSEKLYRLAEYFSH